MSSSPNDKVFLEKKKKENPILFNSLKTITNARTFPFHFSLDDVVNLGVITTEKDSLNGYFRGSILEFPRYIKLRNSFVLKYSLNLMFCIEM